MSNYSIIGTLSGHRTNPVRKQQWNISKSHQMRSFLQRGCCLRQESPSLLAVTRPIIFHNRRSFYSKNKLSARGHVKSCGNRRYQYFIPRRLAFCVCVCVCQLRKKEFQGHAFHLGIPKTSVVCFQKVAASVCF